jgi:hypothetical protein
VLRRFMPRGRLPQLPARESRRMVVLRYLADLFLPAHRYPEAEVNAVLRRYNPDVATLRRALIDTELMQRHAGLYWRTGTIPHPAVRRGDGG